ncbi:UNVERIFIED_CONTAM: hypothetical protein PYX00_003966 [Menopon gallinae]|uniref:Protein trachealess n=1 Tax=Menopon gallinae TaxID=328185 RepID=A0AAW2I2I3_9NEOP
MLPLPAAITSQLDKASIIRLTISYLKLRDFSGHGDPPWQRDNPPPNKSLKGPSRRTPAGLAIEMFEQHQGTHILQSMDGFALVLGADGRLLYVSETVSIYLGLSQVEMSGSSIFDYIHHSDHAEMAEQLGLGLSQSQGLSSPSSGNDDVNSSSGTANPDVATQMSISSSSMYKGLDRAFCIRMKSTLTKRGCHFKSSGYRVVLLLCRLRPQYTFSHSRKSPPPLLGMVALAIALPPPSVHEIRLESDMFVTRINFDFRIAHCEPRVSELLDYTAEELTGKNLYTLCHGEDANKLRKCHIDLINKGQVLTHYYRLMNKSGGYTWIQTCATVVCNSKNAEEQNVICVNYVLSAREYGHLVMDCCQMESTSPTVKREAGQDPENGSPDADPGGRNSGGPASSTPDSHSSPPNSEGRSPESPSERQGRTDQTTQLQGTPTCDRIKVNRTVVNVPLTPNIDKNRIQRKSKKRKLTQEDDSSEDEDVAKGRSSPISEHSSPTQHQPTDFSTDALLKQQRGAIQWVGHHLGQTMPASTLLRQLYANRESVIRANVHAGGRTPTGAGYFLRRSGSAADAAGKRGLRRLRGSPVRQVRCQRRLQLHPVPRLPRRLPLRHDAAVVGLPPGQAPAPGLLRPATPVPRPDPARPAASAEAAGLLRAPDPGVPRPIPGSRLSPLPSEQVL